MTRTTISGIAPFFIVSNVPASLSFYRDMLGFEVIFRGPTPEDEFFGIVRRDGAMILLKALGEMSNGEDVAVEPVPNYGRVPAHSWDAYLEVSDPDALAAELVSRATVCFSGACAGESRRSFVVARSESARGRRSHHGHASRL